MTNLFDFTETKTPWVTSKMSLADFWETIKVKYPAYKDMDSLEIWERMLAKYPEYQDKVSLAPEKWRLEMWIEAFKWAVWRWVWKIKEWTAIEPEITPITAWPWTTVLWTWWVWFIDEEAASLAARKQLAWWWAIAWSIIEWAFWTVPEVWEFISEHVPQWIKDYYANLPEDKQEALDDYIDMFWYLDIAWVWAITKPMVSWIKQIPKLAKEWVELVWEWITKWISKLPEVSPLKWAKQAITRDIPEAVVRKDLWFTPKERSKIETITWKSEWKYILEKWIAWKWKWELAEYFSKQANDNYVWIDNNLKWLKDVPVASKVTTEALEDIYDQLTSSNKFKRAYADDIKAIKEMLERWKYTLLEKHRIRKSFDKVNTWMYTAQWKARSWLDTDIDIKIRQWISDELQKWALEYWIDVKAMNKELRAWIEMKDALLRRLSQEERNNFLWLQDIWVWAILSWWDPFTWIWLITAKKFLEWKAPALAQKAYKLSKDKDVKSTLRRGNTITTGTKSSQLGLADSVRTTADKSTKVKSKPLKKTSKTVKKDVKPPVVKKEDIKPLKKKTKSYNDVSLDDLPDDFWTKPELKTMKRLWLTKTEFSKLNFNEFKITEKILDSEKELVKKLVKQAKWLNPKDNEVIVYQSWKSDWIDTDINKQINRWIAKDVKAFIVKQDLLEVVSKDHTMQWIFKLTK